MEPSKLYEQIYDVDIEDQLELSRDVAKVLNQFVERLIAQGAPPQLIKLMTDCRESAVTVALNLDSIKCCFPNEPKKNGPY